MKPRQKRILLNLIAIFLGFTFFGAGMSKLFADHKFIGWIGPTWLVERLEEYGLGFYGKFIAYSQVLIGYMLITTRYKLIGAVMLVPMLLNILMITISLEWRGTPYVLGFLLFLNGLILWHYRDFWNVLLHEGNGDKRLRFNRNKTLFGDAVWLLGLVLQFLAISVSFHQIWIGLALSLIGLVISLLSFRLDQIYSLRKAEIT
ncbi:hypothetical protein [Algoriphagus formosus]|uniref:hypothetical protein n=1 Tax=Algoriphagus formosus TaxID=2007308 RepID=UPI003F6E8BAD